jgi:hypothetical protein
MFQINPAFHRFPKEATIIGRLLAAFGELEISVCLNAGDALGMRDSVLRALYRLRSTSSRIDTADALMRPPIVVALLASEYDRGITMLRVCLRIRNQFAHCNWADHPTGGLFFTDLQNAAEADEGFDTLWRHVDVELLEQHESYFGCTLEWLRFVDHEVAVRQGRLSSHVWPRPPELEPPPLHNPPLQHVPPWLSEDQKALHIARALAAQGGAPTPTPAQQALDKARAEKRARKQADREAAKKAGRSDPDVPG